MAIDRLIGTIMVWLVFIAFNVASLAVVPYLIYDMFKTNRGSKFTEFSDWCGWGYMVFCELILLLGTIRAWIWVVTRS